MADPSFEAFRKQIGEAAQRKDRAALAHWWSAQGFFWERENGDRADKHKSGIDNLAAALGLNNKDGAGWDMLAGYAEDPTASPSPEHKGALCAPADPSLQRQGVRRADQGDADRRLREWGYPVSAGIEVRATPQANAPVIDKLGLHFVRMMPETAPTPAVLHAHRHAERQDRLCLGRLHRADRQRPDLLRQGRRAAGRSAAISAAASRSELQFIRNAASSRGSPPSAPA